LNDTHDVMIRDLPYRGQASYTLSVAGVERELPLVELAPDVWIASFVLLGDTELTEKCGKALATLLAGKELEAIVVPEGRGLPLGHVIAAELSSSDAYLPYIVARKAIKSYMVNPLIHSVQTVTTAGKQILVLDGADATRLRGARVCVLDDLISTGGTTRAVIELARAAGAEVVCVAAVLLEGAEAVANPEGKTGGVPVVWLGAIPQFIGEAD
jgi:adenine phosphoribosyltransferase